MATTVGFGNDPSGYANVGIGTRSQFTQRRTPYTYQAPEYTPQTYQVQTPAFEQAYLRRIQGGQAGFGTPVQSPTAYNVRQNQFEKDWMSQVRGGEAGFGAPVGDTYAQQQYDILREQALRRQQLQGEQQQEALQRRLAASGFGAGSGMLEAQQAQMGQELQRQAGEELAGLDVQQLAQAEERAARERDYQWQAEQMALQMGWNREEAQRAAYQWSGELGQQAQMQEREIQAQAEQQLLDLGYNREEANRLANQFSEQLRADWVKTLSDQSWKSAEALQERDLKYNLEILGAELEKDQMSYEDALNRAKAVDEQKTNAAYSQGKAGVAVDRSKLSPAELAAYDAGVADQALEDATNERELQFGERQDIIEANKATYYSRGVAGEPLDTDDPLAVAAYNKGVADKRVEDATRQQDLRDQMYGEVISAMTYAVDENGNVDFNKFNALRNQILQTAGMFGYPTGGLAGTSPNPNPPGPNPPGPNPPNPQLVPPSGNNFVGLGGGVSNLSFNAFPGDTLQAGTFQPTRYGGGGNWVQDDRVTTTLPPDAQLVVQTVADSPANLQARINELNAGGRSWNLPIYTAVDQNGQTWQFVLGRNKSDRQGGTDIWYQNWVPAS